MTDPHRIILGPVPCKRCRRPVVWWQMDGVYVLLDEAERPHSCQVLCLAPMMFDDRCARKSGHRGNHTTRYAMDNAARAHRARYAKAS